MVKQIRPLLNLRADAAAIHQALIEVHRTLFQFSHNYEAAFLDLANRMATETDIDDRSAITGVKLKLANRQMSYQASTLKPEELYVELHRLFAILQYRTVKTAHDLATRMSTVETRADDVKAVEAVVELWKLEPKRFAKVKTTHTIQTVNALWMEIQTFNEKAKEAMLDLAGRMATHITTDDEKAVSAITTILGPEPK